MRLAHAPVPQEPHRAVGVGEDSGGRALLEQLVKASYADVWRLCAVLVDERVADDLAQETFLQATRALRRFRGDSSPRTWILAIARHVCMDELRSRHRRSRRAGDLLLSARESAAAPDPAGQVAINELLAGLEPDRRAAFVLTQLLQLSYAEAATVCGCPAGTIRSRVARARDDLIRLTSHEQPWLGREHHGSGANTKWECGGT